TEGGVRNAVWEMAQASGLGVEVDLTKVIVDPAVAEVSKLFGMEPLDAISEGTLLIAMEAHAADQVLANLRKKGIAAADIGAFTKAGRPCADRGRPFRPADRDPIWIAFSRALAGEINLLATEKLGGVWEGCTWLRPRSAPSRGCWKSSEPASKAAHRSSSFATRRSSHRRKRSRPPADFGSSATASTCRAS